MNLFIESRPKIPPPRPPLPNVSKTETFEDKKSIDRIEAYTQTNTTESNDVQFTTVSRINSNFLFPKVEYVQPEVC